MNNKIFLPLIFSIFLLGCVSAMTVYADFTSGSQSATINLGESISFNVDFFSMNPPMTSIKAGLYSGSSLVHSFLNSDANSKTYYDTYTYTPTTAGTFEIRVIGKDKTNTDSEFLALTVNSIPVPPVNNAPVITSTPISNVNEGTSYNYHVIATDSDGDDLAYSLVSSPSWLSINSITGLISGVAPLVSSDTDYSVTARVSDGEDFDTQSYTLTVKDSYVPPSNHAPVITSSPVTSIIEGNVYNYEVDATDSDGDDLSYSIIDGPGWLHINPHIGEITGTAPLVSSDTDNTVTIEVSDGNGGIDTQTYTLKVKDYSYDDGKCSGCSSTRVISDNFYEQNEYFDQFQPKEIVQSKGIAYSDTPTTQKTSGKFGISTSALLYIILVIVVLTIIIAFIIIIRNIR